jgi:hypothetical protein
VRRAGSCGLWGRELAPKVAVASAPEVRHRAARRAYDLSVYLLFLDEAGTPADREFVLGGVAVDVSRWHELRSSWGAAAGAHGRSAEAEVKWVKLNRTGELANRLADVLVQSGVTGFVVELRTREGRSAAPALFASPDDVYATALMFIAERFQRFLAHRGDYGAIILDRREGTQDERLRRFFRRLADNGTPYTRLERIVDPILLSPSHHTLGIQAADLVVGSSLTLSRADRPRSSRRRAAVAREVRQRLLPCFARHPHTGAVDGVGIKRFPDSSAATGKLFDLHATDGIDGSPPELVP